ncbi:MAG: HTH domain-containing protein, partial [Chloroflexota bacterium]
MQSHVNRDERHSLIENILFHSPEGVRAVELAERCGVDRRTIYRDMARLRKNGLPLYQKQGRFFVSREYYHAPVQLTLNETVALFTAVRVLSQVADQHNPHVISALNKLSEGLPEPMAAHVGTVGQMLRHHSVDRLFVRVTETIIHAWGERRWVRIWTAG